LSVPVADAACVRQAVAGGPSLRLPHARYSLRPSLTLTQECNRCVRVAVDADAAAKAAGIALKDRPETIYDALLNPGSLKA
jgi:hypothetical protein